MRSGDTLPPELMEAARRHGIATRIRETRERSRWKQHHVAEHLGITLRAYQKVEEKGTSDYERCQELADFFDVPDVDADYLWEGREKRSPLDVFSEQPGGSDLADRLEWIESALQALLAERGLELDVPRSEPARQRRSDS